MGKIKWDKKSVGTKKQTGLAKGLGIGLGISIGLTLALVLLFAALLDRQVLKESTIGTLAGGTLLLSAGVGAWVAARKVGQRRMVVCLLSACCYFLMLLAATAFLFGGKYQGIPVTAALVFGAAAAAGILGAGGKGNRKRISKKYRIS